MKARRAKIMNKRNKMSIIIATVEVLRLKPSPQETKASVSIITITTEMLAKAQE